MSFEQLLDDIYEKNEQIIDVNSKKFSDIFTSNDRFRKSFYSYFSISGASLVVADALEKKVVLLQAGVEEAKGFPILKIPIYHEKKRDLFIKHEEIKSDDQYNFLINRLFQIQRKFQGLKDYQDDITFKEVPEFLEMLPSLGELPTSKSGKHSHVLIPKFKLLYGFVLWRLFIWLTQKEKIDKTKVDISNLTDEDLIIGGFPGDNCYFSNKNDIPYQNKDLPEYAILDMDSKNQWEGHDDSFYIWMKFRDKVDQVKKGFEQELKIINDVVDPESLSKLKKMVGSSSTCNEIDNELLRSILLFFTNNEGLPNENVIESHLKRLHEEIPLIISYYYFSLIDERIKSHFVFTIWHSPYHPIEYIDKSGNLKKHTSVFNCVVSLDEAIDDTKQIQLTTSFKLLVENVINSVLVERLIRAEQRKDVFQFQRNILLSNSEKKRGVFLLGINEERITFLAQQSRAINLMRALFEFAIITNKSTIAIIGGGVSGVTAAVAAHILGVQSITIFERSSSLLNFQTGAVHRYIHPYIYDWPSTIYQKNEAELPFLRWEAGYADNVLEQLKGGFNKYLETYDVKNINVELNAEVSNVDNHTDSFSIQTNNKINTDFQIVIMAIGQGPEKNKLQDVWTGNYWQPDELEKKFIVPTKILIGGSGDGALVDIIRAKLQGDDGSAIKHKEIFELTKLSSLRHLGQTIRSIDKEYLSNSYLTRHGGDLFELYNERLESNKYLTDAIIHLRNFYREKVEILHCSTSFLLKYDTSLLNRLIVFLLHFDKDVSCVKFEKADIFGCEKKGGKYQVSFDDGQYEKSFDYIFLRFGPNKKYVKPFNLGKLDRDDQIFRLNLTNYISLDTFEWYKETMSKNDNQK